MTSQDIAIVGLAGRFPGARDVEQFWLNLRDGRESIAFFADHELEAVGVDPALLASPRYVKAAGVLEDADLFDAAFFGISSRDAAILDPQQRVFLESAWEALENSGHLPETFPGSIGVYAGAEMSTYLLGLVSGHELSASVDSLQLILGNDKDYLPTRVSYKLDLRGPSVAVQTACSTSLVAVHLACQGLLSGDCDLALAGGVAINFPNKAGYVYQEGGISSPDGHCRAFDAAAQGTVGGNGVGVVVLRPLADAIADGDNIRAVIRGSAMNNDGSAKAGYTAPSVHGQADVIAQALGVAGIDAATIGYVEAHGTATPLGDPIEVAALTRAFGAGKFIAAACAIGSVKTNIGHLGAAAGIAGLIKTVLALEHRMIPPSLHFERPNAGLELEGSPFYVSTRLHEWRATADPRRAGVSSFGIGGTNAHVVLEEAPPIAMVTESGPFHLLVLSAHSEAALAASAARLAARLRQLPDPAIADVAYTLQIGRRSLTHRWALICRDRADAIDALEARGGSGDAPRLPPGCADEAAALDALARRWLAGEPVDWATLHRGAPRRRVALPSYPFERKRYWLDPSRPREDEMPGLRGALPDAGASAPPALRSVRREELVGALAGMVADVSGIGRDEVDVVATFAEVGLDSLRLMEASDAIRARFGVSVPFRRLLEDLSTIDRLATHLDDVLPKDEAAASAPAEPPDGLGAVTAEQGRSARSFIEQVVAEQLRLMSQQLTLLGASAPGTDQPRPGAAAPTRSAAITGRTLPTHPAPLSPKGAGPRLELTHRQRSALDRLIGRYTARTRESKRLSQAYRAVLADNRATARFRLLWKELVYPIVGLRSSGSRIWDADGNEYIDLTMGFGVNLFGHGPDFVTRALEDQLARGLQLGPQSDAAGGVAALICELTGMERATFCNSGTEAVMLALRLARTVSRRAKVALFIGSYHGSFDGTLARPSRRGQPAAAPAAPGVAPGMVEDVLVLEYGAAESLPVLREHAHELAAVLVEPVQSRRPDLQPRAFLQELRRLTEQAGAALIFDEVISGFRSHPGGAQALFDVRADLATYGKVIGGGLPIGVVAGRARWMDAVDGGLWAFGDASAPAAEQTFTAGTFCKHPLAMAAARAVLGRLRAEGEALQHELTARTRRLVDALNGLLQEQRVPIRVQSFASLFIFDFLDDTPFVDLFFYHLIDQGVYVWEGGTCFLSTAHTDEDVERVIRAVGVAIAELREGGFLGDPDADGGRAPNAAPADELAETGAGELSSVSLTAVQRQLWALTQMGSDASAAYNECTTLRMRGTLNAVALRRAVQALVDRHPALRTTFAPDGERQLIHASLNLEMPLIDLGSVEATTRDSRLAELVREQAGLPFDLADQPPLRIRLVRRAEDDHLLILVIHHIITDSWSLGILLQELSALYSADCQGIDPELPPPARFDEYARAQPGEDEDAAAYWLAQFEDAVPELDLPTDRPRPGVRTYAGARVRVTVEPALTTELRSVGARFGCTRYVTLLAAYSLLLHHVARQRDLVLGIHVAGQLGLEHKELVGFCVRVLPLRSRLDGDPTFADHLQAIRARVLDAYEHQNYPLSSLVQRLNLRRDPGRAPLIPATFNLERAGPELELFGLVVEGDSIPTGFAKSEISLNIVEGVDDLLVDCTYNTDLFTERTVLRWMSLLSFLLRTVVAGPGTRLSVLETQLMEEERSQDIAESEQLERAYCERLRSGVVRGS